MGESTNASARYSNYNNKVTENGVETTEEISSLNTSIGKNAPLGTGYGYRISTASEQDINNRDDWQTSERGSFNLNLPFATTSAGYGRSALGVESSSVSIAGGVAHIDGSTKFTRPIHDAFALVRVGKLEGVKVSSGNQVLAKTDSNGEALAHSLSSYHDNTISIDILDLPLNYSLTENKKVFLPPYRGAGVIEFDTKKLQAYEGYAFFLVKGKKIPAKYAGLSIEFEKGKPAEFIVGEDGAFYFENVPSGTYPAKLWDYEKECHFTIVILEGDDIVIDIGEIICEIN
jgi:outer membrane usher protein FimD/PapC